MFLDMDKIINETYQATISRLKFMHLFEMVTIVNHAHNLRINIICYSPIIS